MSTDIIKSGTPSELPVLPLRDVVVYPHMVIPLFVGRELSTAALEEAMRGNKQILLLTQFSADTDEPGIKDLFSYGTVANILQMVKLPDGTVRILVEGMQRAALKSLRLDNHFIAEVEVIEQRQDESPVELEVLQRSVHEQFEQYVKLNKKIPSEVLTTLLGIEDISRFADTIAAHMTLKVEDKQKILELEWVKDRMEFILLLIGNEMEVLELEKRIRGRVKHQMEKSQREYYLNEQMKAIQKELGDNDGGASENDDMAEKIEAAGMTKEAREKAETELKKLKMMSPMSAEATVTRNYIDWLLKLPWNKKSRIRNKLANAEEILEADHYGLEKVKERILEYLAVQQRVKKLKGPILCLVGPPGVGKTSLGKSLARATNREFVRMSLGGVRDEAEIRGHRRTYIGSMPGKIIQKLSKVGKRNPLFLLDEIDKMSMDFRGDPSSALLEVLDPEQNNTFSDHYLEVDFDLSDIMFVATANSLNIPGPLRDRMEIIRIPGYTEDEKINIAKRYLVPKQSKNAGLRKNEMSITDKALADIVRYYTREAGVRGLERQIAKICRKVVKENLLADKKSKKASKKKTAAKKAITKKTTGKAIQAKTTVVNPKSLEKYLGIKRYRFGRADENNQIGQVTGLAWTEVGGELLRVEAAVVAGKGKLTHTGQLGDVMKESIHAAMTVVRSRADALGIDADYFSNHDLHIHVPEGAIPKDGPSAGIGMCTALVSACTDIEVNANVAMTGEITLRGEVLPIGGLKEKLLAAHRGGITKVLIPEENRKDLAEIPDNIKKHLDIQCVQWIDEVLEQALVRQPQPSVNKKMSKPPKDKKAARKKGVQAH
ncbi:MAG: endopeptidase La [Gammaproteobacteria bacterium]|nr:endopeptidase La [Gammaproteobacteria bacterium]NNM12958.1 endopeptidase La [Gammaproteobacteria bacterium]